MSLIQTKNMIFSDKAHIVPGIYPQQNHSVILVLKKELQFGLAHIQFPSCPKLSVYLFYCAGLIMQLLLQEPISEVKLLHFERWVLTTSCQCVNLGILWVPRQDRWCLTPNSLSDTRSPKLKLMFLPVQNIISRSMKTRPLSARTLKLPHSHRRKRN